MIIDEIEELILKAGDGGDGIVSFWRHPKRGPDGGTGGKGGNVIIQAVEDLTVLNRFRSKRKWQAERGDDGKRGRKKGKNGQDLTLKMPVGTYLTDLETNWSYELTYSDEKIIICRGGKGGKGNYEFRSSTNTTPRERDLGQKGQKRCLYIKLRFIADYGFIGLPNAGKSSLLNILTRAHVKTANYPFTTLSPNLGVYQGKILVDIPGLIKGASRGRGLGIKFLKHIEKVSLLFHCISLESKKPLDDYDVIIEEMRKFNPSLLEKEQIILLTKLDLADENQVVQKKKILKTTGKKIITVSIYEKKSLEKLKKIIV